MRIEPPQLRTGVRTSVGLSPALRCHFTVLLSFQARPMS